MTEAVLISVISALCNGLNTTDSTVSIFTAKRVKEARIDCYEKYTNCAVKFDGKIITLKEFNNQCLRK